jgi:hypothetical protein
VKLYQHAPRSEYGSFASMDCSHLPAGKAAYLSHSGSNVLRPQQQHSLALHPPSTLVPPGACSATASERNQRRWPARLFAIQRPFPFLHPSFHLLSGTHLRGDPQVPAHCAHTHVYSRPAKFIPPDTSTFSMTYRLATLPPPLHLDAVITATSCRTTLARRAARLSWSTFRQYTQT